MSRTMPFKMNESLSITVITKLITPNVGNQAISTELVRLLEKTYPDAHIYAGWREPGLEPYSFPRLLHAGPDPLRTLDGWVERIIERFNYDGKTRSPEREESLPILQAFELSRSRSNPVSIVELAPVKVLTLPMRIYGKGLRTLKMPFDRWRGYERGYERWLTVLRHSDWVIYSPAGEMGDLGDRVSGKFVLRDLLSLRIAQKLGSRVTAVNQSIEVKHPLLLRLLGQVYSSFDSIVVRDPESAQLLMEMQVPQERITLAPDTAFLAQPAPMEERELNEIAVREKIEPGTVGITAVPWKGAVDLVGWGKVIQQLQAMGKQVLFVSNQMYDDVKAGIMFQKLYGVKVLSRQYDYNEYIRVLSLMELIISERYHTCMFSAIANKPFIPLNILKMHKVPGLVSLLNYTLPPIDTTCAGWQDTVIDHVHYIYKHYDKINTDLQQSVLRMTSLAKQNAGWNSELDRAGALRIHSGPK